jgi:hypothetical protein
MWISSDVRGTFILAPESSDPLFTTYRLTEISWDVMGYNGEIAHKVTGQGSYRLGGEFALMHQLTLDLSIDGNGPEHLDSGLVAGGSEFPIIAIPVARGTPCFDIGMWIRTAPTEGGFPVANLESPVNGQKVSGIASIYGWALDKKGITKADLFIDGQYAGNIPYGGSRMDVKNAYPDYPAAENSGFSTIMNYSILSPGDHIVKVRVHNQEDLAIDLNASVTVMKFHGEFVEKVSPSNRTLRDNSVTVDGVTKKYDIKIEWSNESQGYQITDIIEK